MHNVAARTDPYAAIGDAGKSPGNRLEALKSSIAELIDHPALSSSPNLAEIRTRINNQINEASTALESAQASAREVVSEQAGNIDEYVRDEPWKVAGIAAALGLAVGVALARR